jgi:hypothetical protein
MHQAAQLHQTDENALARQLLSHWDQELGAVGLVKEPFEHLYTERVWPSDIYDQLLRLLPPDALYEPLNIKQWVNAKGVSTRDKCYLPKIITQMDPKRAAFWRQIWLALTADSLKRAVFRKFKNDIALRLGSPANNVEETEVSVHISLARDIEDYHIKPHPDGWPAVVTAQFYLPADASQSDLGTSFYVERPLLTRFLLGRFQEVKRMQFMPNSGYFFAVNDLSGHRSLHGREWILPGAGVRNTMLVRWSLPSASHKRGSEGVSPTHQFI